MEHEALSEDQVIGQRLIEIRQVSEFNKNGLDWTTSYFVLESGISFALPDEFADGLCYEAPPAESERLSSGAEAILGVRIVALLRPKLQYKIPNESLYLCFENGYLVTDIMGAYHGTASTGVYIFAPGEVDSNLLKLIWGEMPGG